MGKVRLEPVAGTDGNFSWGMKDEEFMADFCLVSKRALEEEEYQIFRFYSSWAPTGDFAAAA